LSERLLALKLYMPRSNEFDPHLHSARQQGTTLYDALSQWRV
jgi:hypothetical protein